jgi:hypothetical protein
MVQEALKLLGLSVRDAVTNFTGVVTSVTFDLYGCIQTLVNPGMDKEGKLGNSQWFDKNRLIVLDKNPVIKQPSFVTDDKGPEEKPQYKGE